MGLRICLTRFRLIVKPGFSLVPFSFSMKNVPFSRHPTVHVASRSAAGMPDIAAVVVAAGRGTRAASGDLPKQFRPISGESLLRRTLVTLVQGAKLDRVQPVIHPDDLAHFQNATAGIATLPPVYGGATRQQSVRCGLEALSGRPPDIVLGHDAARPFASTD